VVLLAACGERDGTLLEARRVGRGNPPNKQSTNRPKGADVSPVQHLSRGIIPFCFACSGALFKAQSREKSVSPTRFKACFLPLIQARDRSSPMPKSITGRHTPPGGMQNKPKLVQSNQGGGLSVSADLEPWPGSRPARRDHLGMGRHRRANASQLCEPRILQVTGFPRRGEGVG
jgi:hypothetical protein